MAVRAALSVCHPGPNNPPAQGMGAVQASIADESKPSLDEEPADPPAECVAGRGAGMMPACDTPGARVLGDLLELGPMLMNAMFGDHGMHHRTSSLQVGTAWYVRHDVSWFLVTHSSSTPATNAPLRLALVARTLRLSLRQ